MRMLSCRKPRRLAHMGRWDGRALRFPVVLVQHRRALQSPRFRECSGGHQHGGDWRHCASGRRVPSVAPTALLTSRSNPSPNFDRIYSARLFLHCIVYSHARESLQAENIVPGTAGADALGLEETSNRPNRPGDGRSTRVYNATSSPCLSLKHVSDPQKIGRCARPLCSLSLGRPPSLAVHICSSQVRFKITLFFQFSPPLAILRNHLPHVIRDKLRPR